MLCLVRIIDESLANVPTENDRVWRLPPTLRAEGEAREVSLAIGESDRMTLKFAKPK